VVAIARELCSKRTMAGWLGNAAEPATNTAEEYGEDNVAPLQGIEPASTGQSPEDQQQSAAMELLFKVANATTAVVCEAVKGQVPAPGDSSAEVAQQPLEGDSAAPAQSSNLQTPPKKGAPNGVAPRSGENQEGNEEGDDEDYDDDYDEKAMLDFSGLSLDTTADDSAASPAPATDYFGSPDTMRSMDRSFQGRGAAGNSGEGKVQGRYRRGGNWNQYNSRHQRMPMPPPMSSLKALPQDSVHRLLSLVQEGDLPEALRTLRKVRRSVKGRGCSKEAYGGMRALLHHLLESYSCAGRLQEAVDFLGEMRRGAEARLVCAAAFNALLRGLLVRGMIDDARWLVREEMPRMGVQPNEGTMNLLMDTAARAGPGYSDEAWDVLEEMQCKGMRADKYTVSILTKAISDRTERGKRAPRGVALVERFLATQADDVDEVLINSLLDVFCRMGDMPRLEATLQRMREYGIRGSAVTYGTIVKAYGKTGNIDKVLQAWTEMRKEGLEANAVTYGCMLDACVKCGHLEKALHVFQLMKESGLHRNTILYATLIKGFAKAKDPAAARSLHKEMLEEGVLCNVVVFNSLIDACVRANDLHGAAEVLTQMAQADVQPDLITFSTLIKGYCASGELSKAMILTEELRSRDLECDEIVYNSLLEGCVKAGDLRLGIRLFSEMRQHGVRPSSVTFSILVKLLARAGRLDLACHLVSREMRELHGVTPTRMVWSCLVTCCVKARDLNQAVLVLDLLDHDGGAAGTARGSMYATVIEGCLGAGEVAMSLSLCERAFSRAPVEEGVRGLLPQDLLRRVFEAAVMRGPEAEARNLLEAIKTRVPVQVRSQLEEVLNTGGGGGVRRGPKPGRDRHGGPGTSEAAQWLAGGSGGMTNYQWPQYMHGNDEMAGNMMQGAWGHGSPYDNNSDWNWLQSPDGYANYGYDENAYYQATGWQWQGQWEEGQQWQQAASSGGPCEVRGPPDSWVSATPAQKDNRFGQSASKDLEETPITTAGRTPGSLVRTPAEGDDEEEDSVNLQLFPGAPGDAPGAALAHSKEEEAVVQEVIGEGPPGLC